MPDNIVFDNDYTGDHSSSCSSNPALASISTEAILDLNSLSSSTPANAVQSDNNENKHKVFLKLNIPTNPYSFSTSTTSQGLTSCSMPLVSSSLFSDESPSSRLPLYSDLVPLPTPQIRSNTTSTIFKVFSGQSPPSTNISRASSMRTFGYCLNNICGSTTPNTAAAAAAASMAAAVANKPTLSSSLSPSLVYTPPGLNGIKLDEDYFSGPGTMFLDGRNFKFGLDTTSSTPTAAHIMSHYPNHNSHHHHYSHENTHNHYNHNHHHELRQHRCHNSRNENSHHVGKDNDSIMHDTHLNPTISVKLDLAQLHSNRSVSEYVPQPTTGPSLVSCQPPSLSPPKFGNDLDDKMDVDEKEGCENEHNNNTTRAPVALPSSNIYVEKRSGRGKHEPLLTTLKDNVGNNCFKTNNNSSSNNSNKVRSASSGSPVSRSSIIHREVPITSRNHQQNQNQNHNDEAKSESVKNSYEPKENALNSTVANPVITAPTSTSSGSLSSATSTATTDTIETTASSIISTDSQETFTPAERVYEAYDTNMKKSTWNELEMLGRGAFSRVFLGCPVDRYMLPEYQQRSHEFKVAIKIVDIQLEGNQFHSKERMESGLKREIEILKVSDIGMLIFCVFL